MYVYPSITSLYAIHHYYENYKKMGTWMNYPIDKKLIIILIELFNYTAFFSIEKNTSTLIG